MRQLSRLFLRGLVFGIPVGLTVGICYAVFTKVDSLLWPVEEFLLGEGRHIPGVGFASILLGTLVLGVLVSSFLTRQVMRSLERVLERLPMVKLLYTSIRDLLVAFVGEKRRFDRPVRVSLGATGLSVLGFITRDDLESLGLSGEVAVYVPQSYNFAGNLMIASKDSVTPLSADSGAVMAFVVSGGASLAGEGKE